MSPEQANALAELEMLKADRAHEMKERKDILVAKIVKEDGRWKIFLPYYADQT